MEANIGTTLHVSFDSSDDEVVNGTTPEPVPETTSPDTNSSDSDSASDSSDEFATTVVIVDEPESNTEAESGGVNGIGDVGERAAAHPQLQGSRQKMVFVLCVSALILFCHY